MDISAFTKPADHPLHKPVLDTLWHKYRTTPRHTQMELGPSQIGEPCTRKLGYAIMRHPSINDYADPLPSIVGTAAHTWMEEACRQWNEHTGRIDWIPETKLNIAPGIIGHSDAYHVPTRSVVDWKFPGQTALAATKRDGPSDVYRAQPHLYGLGYTNLGLPVDHVVLVFFPRGGNLKGMHIWSEPYDPDIAQQALQRYYTITKLCIALDVDSHPERYQLLDRVEGHHCTFCTWFRPGPDTGDGCPGFTTKGAP